MGKLDIEPYDDDEEPQPDGKLDIEPINESKKPLEIEPITAASIKPRLLAQNIPSMDSSVASKLGVPSSVGPGSSKDLQLLLNNYAAPSQNENNLSDILSSLKGDKEAQLMAMQMSNSNQLMNNLGRAGNTVGAAIARQKADNSGYDAMAPMATAPMQQQATMMAMNKEGLQTAGLNMALQSEMEKNKADSQMSVIGRGLLQSEFDKAHMNIKVPQNMTYAQMENFFGKNAVSSIVNRTLSTESAAKLREALAGNKNDQFDKTFWQKEQDKLQADAKEASSGVSDMKNLLNNIEIAKKNPVMKAAIPMELARAIIHSRVAVQEINQLQGAQDLPDKLQQMAQQMSQGTLTDTNYKYFKELATQMLKGNQKALEEVRHRHAKRASANAKVPVPDAYSRLTGDTMDIEPPANAEQAGGGGTTLDDIAAERARRKAQAKE